MGATRVLTGLVLAGALALAGCTAPDEGGGVATASPDPTPTASPEEQVTAVATELGTSSDPAQCTELYTTRGLEVAVGSTDLDTCREAVRTSEPADEMVVDRVVVDGGTATARVTSVDGASAGLAQTLALVLDGDRWKVDGVAGLAVADRGAFDDRVARELARWGPQVLPPDSLACVQQQLQRVPDAEVVAAFQEGRAHDPAVSAISSCLGAGVDAAAMYAIVLYQLQTKGLTEEQAGGLAVEVLDELVDLTLEQIVTSEAARARLEQGLLDGAATQVCQQVGAAP